ncbi:hypothetical protein MJO29_012544 [Puccinia striiformis f. sp. tritici]|nr:hypothetical protein Pst134EB_024020 [Puccinia striiformis f. sp. tritici]KAI7946156.1 hypothetical protein MJO29_012544 [Puccinia striiformis f. sp. tritici]KAI9631057.1 hypothetical protein KEM48_013314 [Puccinia striiformis f. sp. tritici PST-130]
MPAPTNYDNEEEGHELRSTHYQPYQQQQNYPVRSQEQNAFGDDSDSEDGHPQQHPIPHRDDQPPEFDVYKDFNNSGVRYTTLLHGNTPDGNKLDNAVNNEIHSPAFNEKGNRTADEDDSFIHPELVDTSASHSRLQANNNNSSDPKSMKDKLSGFKNSKNRWKVGSIIAFVCLACIGAAIYFVIPRQPFISFESRPPSLIRIENNNLIFSARNPTNFSFDAGLDITIDGRPSYLPTRISNFKAIISDLGATNDPIRLATGSIAKSFTASNRNLNPLTLDLHFEYTTKLPSDLVWQTWRKACGNIQESTINGTITRPSVQVLILIEFNVLGMIGTKFDSTQLTNVGCPAELPAGAPSF